ncbi:Longitudinals lacking protein-like [Armadillidium vulgare]|nr:Longitudinals lacking protein-like [Armadillidium vulgare]
MILKIFIFFFPEMVEQHFCLRWNNYRTNITAEFETLREGEHFVDVTLACDGRQLKAHKVVLSACSPYFKELLQGNPCSHPIIILKDVAYTHMRSLLEFMYAGEVNISQAHLGSFLHTAEALKIRGLAESSDTERKDGIGNTNCMSPLTQLKTTLGSYSGISLGGLGSSLLERPLMPQLLPHPGEPPPPNTSQPPTLNMVPSSLPLPSTSYSSSGSSGGGPGSSKAPSPEKTLGDHQGPIALTVNTHHANDLSGGTRHKTGGDSERKEPSSPLSLPPNKRIRSERRMMVPAHSKDHGSSDTKAPNGCPYPTTTTTLSSGSSSTSSSNSVSALDTATSKISTTTIPGTEDIPDTIPKVEPLDPPVSDTEGSVGWTEEGESVGIGGETSSYPSPPEPPPPQNVSGTGGMADSENTSQLVQALSEPHLPVLFKLTCMSDRRIAYQGSDSEYYKNWHINEQYGKMKFLLDLIKN